MGNSFPLTAVDELAKPASPRAIRRVGVTPWPWIAIVFILALQARMIFTRAINWDEFFYFGQVYHFAATGVLNQPLQSFHVRLFGWILDVGHGPVDHIIAARCVMFICEIVTASAIAAIASKFTDRVTGLLCAACYLSAGFVMQHGFSFRVDPAAAACLMSALWILACSRLSIPWLILFGILVAVGGMITIKIVLYAPAFVGLAWYRWSKHGFSAGHAARLVAAPLLALLFFGVLFYFHGRGIAPVHHEVVAGHVATAEASANRLLHSSARKMFSLGPQPYWPDIPRAAAGALAFTFLIVLTPFALAQSGRSVAEKIAIAGLLLPLSTLLFYHNTAPYFYAYILPPVAVACCVAIVALRKRLSAALLVLALVINALVIWAADRRTEIDNQRITIAAAHQIFRQPVGYFDFCDMLSDFPKANGFMTMWAKDGYLASGKLVYRDALMKHSVPLLLEDASMYTDLLRSGYNDGSFAPEDADTLRSTYVHFWGYYWLAGQELHAGEGPRKVEMLVPGPYTARGGPIDVDGRRIQDGQVVKIERGMHTLSAVSHDARLIWGDRLEVPDEPEPGPLWVRF